MVNDIQRQTDAYIGQDPTAAGAIPGNPNTGTATITAGALSVSADTSGFIVGAGIAGSYSNNEAASAPPAPSADPSLDPNAIASQPSEIKPPAGASTTSGIGIAGSALVDVIRDTTLAYIERSGTISALPPP